MHRNTKRLGKMAGSALGALLLSTTAQAVDVSTLLEPSPAERADAQARLQLFYSGHPAEAMFRRVPKFDAATGQPVDTHPELNNHKDYGNPLLNLAQEKATPEFDAAYCKFLTMHFPGYRCPAFNGTPTWSTTENDDNIESLAYSWTDSVTHNLDQIPLTGATKMPLWSDDYWKTRYGQTSYRYASRGYFNSYNEAIRSYSQPAEWDSLLAYLDPSQIAQRVVDWSPSEKYDITVGDEAFSLTTQQKASGRASAGPSGDVESWMGLCHGWSAASIMVPRPMHSATMTGVRGMKVTWYPADVRAMLTLAWGNGKALSNFVGGRCRATNPETYPNGRVKAQECFDTNPSTFHLALGNMIGRKNLAFVMDATYDYQVWNQPVAGYSFTYFNPLDPTKTSGDWKAVAVPYDDAFKAKDPFQKPLTRGIRNGDTWDDKGIAKIVGVTATVTYLVETQPPDHVPNISDENYTHATYTYDLELHNEGGQLMAEGGEWSAAQHPDFLWLPRKTTSVRTSYDYLDLGVDPANAPGPKVTSTAVPASGYGYPLCQVLKQLVKQSSGQDAYQCPDALP